VPGVRSCGRCIRGDDRRPSTSVEGWDCTMSAVTSTTVRPKKLRHAIARNDPRAHECVGYQKLATRAAAALGCPAHREVKSLGHT